MNEWDTITKAIDLKALIYCRISSVAQAQKGDGLRSQETYNREYCKRKGYEIERVFYDRAISGKLSDRPGIKELIQFLRRTKNAHEYVVVFDDVSRFARDMRTHLDLRDAIINTGAQIDCPNVEFREDAQGRYFEELQALGAQHHGRHNAEQTKKRMRSRMVEGYYCFAAPLGYKYKKMPDRGNVLVRKEPIASVIEEALVGYASGRFDSQAEVKRYLESQHDFTEWKKGNKVSFEDVNRLLTRHIYSGYIEYSKWGITLREGKHEGLIGLRTYDLIQERINGGTRVAARKDINADFPLRGFVTCGDCEKPLTANWSKSKTGVKHPYYMCFNKECCSHRKSIRRNNIESEFETLLMKMRPSGRLFNYLQVIFKGEWEKRLSRFEELKQTLNRDIQKLERQIDKMMDQLVETDSETAVRAYEKRIERLEKEKLLKTEKLRDGTHPAHSFDELFELAMGFLANPCKLWSSDRLEDKRTLLKLAFEGRIAYQRNEGLRTPKTALPFNILGDTNMGKFKMAERKGMHQYLT